MPALILALVGMFFGVRAVLSTLVA